MLLLSEIIMSAIDLTNVAAVNLWLGNPSGTDQTLIQSAITNFSRYVLRRTGRRFLSGFKSYTERYDGNGSERLMTREYPILSLAALTVGYQTIPQSPDSLQPGWVIEESGDRATVALVGAGGFITQGQSAWEPGLPRTFGGPYRFFEGIQNVGISYTAGSVLDALSEEQTVPASAPYTVTAANAASWWADLGATNSAGASLADEYTVANGVYTFAASLAGQEVELNYQYGGTPEDLAQAATQLVATMYRRRGWIDQLSQMQPGVGTTSYSRLEMPPEVTSVIERYTRRFVV